MSKSFRPSNWLERETMKILALDLGSKTGWAIGNGKVAKEFGEVNFVRRGLFDGGSFHEADLFLGEKVLSADLVVVERPNGRMPGFHAYRVLFGLYGLVENVCFSYSRPLHSYAATTIKKSWTGSGRAKKPEMVDRALLIKAYKDVKSHNVADAIALYHLAWSIHGNI